MVKFEFDAVGTSGEIATPKLLTVFSQQHILQRRLAEVVPSVVVGKSIDQMRVSSKRDHTLRSACVALSLLLVPSLTEARENQHLRSDNTAAESLQDPDHSARLALLSPGSTIGDILYHPAFAGFAGQILPWDGGAYDANMRARRYRFASAVSHSC